MQFLKKWGSEYKDFEKFGTFMQSFWKKEGLNVILQNAGLKMQFYKINMHQDKFWNHMGDWHAILKLTGSKMQFFQQNRSLSGLEMQTGDLHAIFQMCRA